MKIVGHDNFITPYYLFETNNIFIVPHYQRPFSWGEKELRDLYEDIEQALNNGDIDHYLSAIHIVKYNEELAELLPKFDVVQEIIENYQKEIKPIQIYMVVDGQQRLTTLYLIYCLCGIGSPYVHFGNIGKDIERVIPNIKEDYDMLKDLIKKRKSISGYKFVTLSQKRLNEIAENICKHWVPQMKNPDWQQFYNNRLKLLAIELPIYLATVSFLTINDRGKKLTSLDRFKALMAEKIILSKSGNINMIFNLFGKIYRNMDFMVRSGWLKEEEVDDRVLQYMFVYSELETNHEYYWQSGDRAYQIMKDLANRDPKKPLIWIKKLENLNDSLQKIADNFSTIDDYKIFLCSLRPEQRTVAILLKFNELFNKDFHQKNTIDIAPLKGASRDALDLIDDFLTDIKTIDPFVTDYKSFLEKTLKSIRNEESDTAEISALELCELIDLFLWKIYKNPAKTFYWYWISSSKLKDLNKFFETWLRMVVVDYDYYFIRTILQEDNEPLFRYLLKEYNFCFENKNIHFQKLELEHIFPQGPSGILLRELGINEKEYNLFIKHSGNLALLTEETNKSAGNQEPLIKRNIYLKSHKEPEISKCVTKAMLKCKNNKGIYEYLQLRCAELALFAVTRFLPQYKHFDFCSVIKDFYDKL